MFKGCYKYTLSCRYLFKVCEILILKYRFWFLSSIFSFYIYAKNKILECDFFFSLKGKYKLAKEIKEKEIEGLKETLKTLQVK